ncbi:hypothetical protein [Brenneria salicis]|uniref:hypothetical protein n=1 Tax=Brenneria salicis TaxID=55214 RepID=UPI00145B06A8|nr:hypothetical protein [Brenneria salicis]
MVGVLVQIKLITVAKELIEYYWGDDKSGANTFGEAFDSEHYQAFPYGSKN